MKTPSKKDLYERVAALEKENIKIAEERDRDREKRWMDFLPRAYEVCRQQLKSIFLNAVENIRFEHVDASGYWFSFRLTNDSRRQTYSVIHSEVHPE